MRPMQKSPGGLSLSAGAFLHKADTLCEVSGVYMTYHIYNVSTFF